MNAWGVVTSKNLSYLLSQYYLHVLEQHDSLLHAMHGVGNQYCTILFPLFKGTSILVRAVNNTPMCQHDH